MPDGTSAFTIRIAEREAMPALVAFWGPSNSGKTMSALKLARGLVGPEGRIGMIDTENKRAKMYAKISEPWDHLDLQPPFTPDRYREALQAFERAGERDKRPYGCIIVDSFSHIWQGEGGVLDMAENARTRNGRAMEGLAKWKAPKMAFQRAQNYFLRAPFHIVFCLRAKDGVRQKGGGANAEIEHVGLEPICEKNFIYEMTVSILLGPDHKPLFQPIDRFKASPIIPPVKAPEDLIGAFPAGQFIGEEAGRRMAAWIGGGVQLDANLENLKRIAADIASLGTEKLKAHWKSLSVADQRALQPYMDGYKATAAAKDREDALEDDPFQGDTDTDTGRSAAETPVDDPFADEPSGEADDREGDGITDAAGQQLDLTSAG